MYGNVDIQLFLNIGEKSITEAVEKPPRIFICKMGEAVGSADSVVYTFDIL